jgi:hypothetical protein
VVDLLTARWPNALQLLRLAYVLQDMYVYLLFRLTDSTSIFTGLFAEFVSRSWDLMETNAVGTEGEREIGLHIFLIDFGG